MSSDLNPKISIVWSDDVSIALTSYESLRMQNQFCINYDPSINKWPMSQSSRKAGHWIYIQIFSPSQTGSEYSLEFRKCWQKMYHLLPLLFVSTICTSETTHLPQNCCTCHQKQNSHQLIPKMGFAILVWILAMPTSTFTREPSGAFFSNATALARDSPPNMDTKKQQWPTWSCSSPISQSTHHPNCKKKTGYITKPCHSHQVQF